MKVKTIRWIDLYPGRVLCFLLTLWRRLIRPLTTAPKKGPERILFIKFIEQGATVLAYSAIKKAIDRVGAENVFFCVFRPNRPILDLIGILPEENVLEIRDDHLLVFLADTLRLFFRCRQLKIDSTVDMEFFSRASVIFAYLCGARRRAGLHRYTSELPYRGRLLTHEIQYNPYLHTSTAYLLLVESLFHDQRQVPVNKFPLENLQAEAPKFQFQPEELTQFRGKLQAAYGGPLPSTTILLNPNASDMLPLRKWETRRFLELGQQLLAQYDDLLIVITGAPSEQEVAQKIADRFQSLRVISMAGKTSMRELLLLYQLSDLLVTNDSGPAHFASMTDTQILVLFGPETPQLFGPLGEKVRVVWKKLGCSPCVNAMNHRFSPCTDNVCMQMISVEEVFQICVEVLDEPQAEQMVS